ncbi:MAG: cation transporter [Saprospiraceae bacterium]
MKTLNQNIFSAILCLSLLIALPTILSAQKGRSCSAPPAKTASANSVKVEPGDQTVTLVVPGVCGMCKARIESTAMDVSGVKKAEWDQQTDTLVLLGSSKMDRQKVADALAKAGYRSDLAKADPKGYSKLPSCCQYDSGAKKE